MGKTSWTRGPLLAALLVVGCDDELVDGRFTAAEWERVQELGPLPDLEPDPTNRHGDDPAAPADLPRRAP